MTIEEALKTNYRYAVIDANTGNVVEVTNHKEDFEYYVNTSARNVRILDLRGDDNAKC